MVESLIKKVKCSLTNVAHRLNGKKEKVDRRVHVGINYKHEAFKLLRATEYSVGYDILSPYTVYILPNSVTKINTGVFLDIPMDSFIECQVRSRSGLASKGIFVVNAPGTIDPDYKGEVGVLLGNLTNTAYKVTRGDAIAQLVFNRVSNVKFGKDLVILRNKIRGDGGFGSTG